MTEYWVSKKQYWCKYCNQYIRDDAPSRKQHETGLKHQGNKERFIRDLYKSGSIAKREKANAEAEMARINAAAEAAYAKDTHTPASRPMLARMHPSAGASTSKPRESSKPKDKWANYTSAKDLGIEGLDTTETTFAVEQQLKGRAANDIGAWETVVEPPPPVVYYAQDGAEDVVGGKRKLGEYEVNDEAAEGEEFKFAHKGKRPIRDPYDDDDWDPKAALGQIKLKSKLKKEESAGTSNVVKQELQTDRGVAMDRSKWTGRLEMNANGADVPKSPSKEYVFLDGGWNKVSEGENAGGPVAPAASEATDRVKPDEEDVKPILEDAPVTSVADRAKSVDELAPDAKPDVPAGTEASAPSSMFKKRRPPPKKK